MPSPAVSGGEGGGAGRLGRSPTTPEKKRERMSTHYQFYLDRAADARRDADAATLTNVRERCLRAAAAWEDMANRVARTERMRAETEAKKAAEAQLMANIAPAE